jgi:hypothetical protein
LLEPTFAPKRSRAALFAGGLRTAVPLAESPGHAPGFDIVIRCMKVGIDGNRRLGASAP